MSINAAVIAALKDIGIPVNFQVYNGDATQYITFFEYNQTENAVYDDKEARTNHYIQVDIWSASNYSALVDATREALLEAGFVRRSENENYEAEMKLYHKVIRLIYVEERN
jgi:hypothetical protein